MTNRELATLAVKLLGVYCLILVVGAAPGMGYWLGMELETLAPLLLGIASLLLFTFLGVWLIWKSDSFVRLVVPTAEAPTSERGGASELQGVLFSVIGVVLVVHALPRIILTIFVYSRVEEWEKGTSGLERAWPQLAAVALEIVLGVALFVGSRGLARMWRRIGEMNQRP